MTGRLGFLTIPKPRAMIPKKMERVIEAFGVCFVMLAGCSVAPRITDTSRTAVEELLISEAVDRAVSKMSFRSLRGRKVFVDDSKFNSIDKGYVTTAFRASILESGASLIEDKSRADVIVEIRCGALAIDRGQLFFGFPEIPLLTGASGTLLFPEVALYKLVTQRGISKLGAVAYDRQTGKLIFNEGPYDGQSYYKRRTLLILIYWATTNIPQERGAFLTGKEWGGPP